MIHLGGDYDLLNPVEVKRLLRGLATPLSPKFKAKMYGYTTVLLAPPEANARWRRRVPIAAVLASGASGGEASAHVLAHHVARHEVNGSMRPVAVPRSGDGVCDGSFRSLLARLSRIGVLAIDDWAMAPLSEPERRDFWEICEDRYQIRSTILTSQLPISCWHE
jgi:hypothetical protein